MRTDTAIEEIVLKDMREGDGQFSGLLTSDPEWADYSKRYGIYAAVKKAVDADHWKAALDSYRSYPCFQNDRNYYWNKISIEYDNGIHYVRISADILSNAGSVKDWIDSHGDLQLSDDEKRIIKAFFRVSYTMGNFCPIWKNTASGRGRGKDNIWYKLASGGIRNTADTDLGIENRSDPNNNMKLRKAENLFNILPGGKDYIRELFLIDYFVKDRIIWENGYDVSGMDKDTFIEYVRLTTVLIVRRGYRIATQSTEDDLDPAVLVPIYEKIGLNGIDVTLH